MSIRPKDVPKPDGYDVSRETMVCTESDEITLWERRLAEVGIVHNASAQELIKTLRRIRDSYADD